MDQSFLIGSRLLPGQASFLIDVGKNPIDTIYGIIIPRRKNQDMRAVCDLALIKSNIPDLFLYFRIPKLKNFLNVKDISKILFFSLCDQKCQTTDNRDKYKRQQKLSKV